jgi:hypothetical protein
VLSLTFAAADSFFNADAQEDAEAVVKQEMNKKQDNATR